MQREARFEAAQTDDGRYRLLIDGITDYAIYMLDPDGIVTSWNPGAQRFKGYTAGEIIGQHFSVFYSDEERARGLPEQGLRTALEEGRFEREGWRIRKDGGRFWAHVVIDPIRDPSGALVGFAKVTRDLTERRAADEALRSSQEQFRRLVQGVTDYAIYMLDAEGHVSNWNPGAERIKGYRPAEIIGQHFSRFYTDEDRLAGLPAEGLQIARREGRWEQEGWRVRKDGSRFWAHVIIDVIRDDDGSVIGFAKITRDITERMQTQRSLEEAREALFQSQKLEAIGQLTGGVAHDFNNLLMAVLGSLELLKKRVPADPLTDALIANALEGARRGTGLTQRMLAFARRQDLNLEPVDLAAVARNMIGFMERTLGPAVRIDMDFPAELPPALADANQVETALLNLAVNARDAMPDGGLITVSARVHSQSGPGTLEPGDYVVLAVADTGEGMDEDTLKRATEPFFTTKGVGKGTGLGLSMVHGLAAQSGGCLSIKSRKGEGALVEVWLPVAAQGDLPRPLSAAPEAPRPADRRCLTILAVDDDCLVLSNTAALLEDLGHRVLQADSGQEALEILGRTAHLDVVVTDQAMPGMTGLQLCETIRKLRPGLPLLIATGYAELPPGSDPDLPRLSKPFMQKALADAVLKAVDAEPVAG